jgi:glycosyltransferase involved in cell wall biosynthesis
MSARAQAEPVPVSVVVALWNAATTIIPCLKGLAEQEYPIAEIIVIDNVSTDASPALVEAYAAECPVPLRLVRQAVNGGLSTSYTAGMAMARSPLVVFVHSDSMLPSPRELGLLVAPLLEDPQVVASYSTLLMPLDVWGKFPFWQKYLFARVALREQPCMCGKFDCIRKEVYQRVGGHNTRRFTQNAGYGGEDSDLNHRLLQQGRVAGTAARVVHLHDLSSAFGLKTLFLARKNYARTYGKILRFQGLRPIAPKLLFFAKPLLACLPLAPHLLWASLGLLLAYSLAYSKRMYTTRCTVSDPRILLVPLVDVALLYHESYWFIEGLLTPPADSPKRAAAIPPA